MVPDAPTYERYREWGGSASEAAFSERVSAAKAHVDWLIGSSPITDGEAYADAICAAVDAVEGTCAATVGSISIGSFSASGGGAAVTDESAMTDAAMKVLAPTGMLYAGLA